MINKKIKTDLLNEYNKRKTNFNAKLFQKVMQKWEVYRTKILNGNFQLDEYTNLKNIAPNYLMHFLIYDKECESVLGNSNVQNMQHTMLKRNSKTSDWYLNKTRKFPLNASADRTAAENYFTNYILPLLTNIVNSCSTISTLHHFTRTNGEWEDFINKNPLHKIIVLESLYSNNSQYNIYCNVMPFYKDEVLDKICKLLDISTNGLTTFEKMHTIMDVIYSELNVPREPETVIIMWQILWDMISSNSKVTSSTSKIESSKDGETEEIDEAIDSIDFNAGAYNKIFYGVPGCGKSYHIEHNVLDEIFQNCGGKKEKNIFRTIFYQDYSRADFVGQYMPKRIKGQVEYTFVPKVFTKALERAYQCPNEPVVLVIEEINRGDAASIFGDIFQLLDRDKDGKSEYEIDCDEIVDYLSAVKNKNEVITNIVGENEKEGTNKIYIPSNLYLLATMNTCDQNVFALDTAFKRRWDMEEIPNEFKKDYEIKDMLVPYNFDGTYITWEKFVKVVNKQIVNSSDEFFGDDRQIGCFFVDDTCLLDTANDTGTNKAENFAYKVISYLWNDVAKLNRNEWFDDSANDGVKTLHDAITKFVNGNDVFSSTLKTELLENESQPSAPQAGAEENESIEE